MNNKAEALRNLSVPAFEVMNTPDEAARRRLCILSLPEAVLCLLPMRVTSMGRVVALQVLAESV